MYGHLQKTLQKTAVLPLGRFTHRSLDNLVYHQRNNGSQLDIGSQRRSKLVLYVKKGEAYGTGISP